MATVVGSGEFRYEAIEKWPDLPDGRRLIETPGVAVQPEHG